MPTLHLIDAESSQACPAVMSVIRRSMASSCGDDRLLMFGGQPLTDLAQQAGIAHAHRISVPFGKAYLGQRKIKHWLRTQAGFDRAVCWSIGTLRTAVSVFTDTPIQISLIHTPTPSELRLLKRIILNRHGVRIRVCVWTPAVQDQLNAVGIPAEVDPALTELSHNHCAPPLSRTELRSHWHASDPSRRVVALLCDHPSLADAVDAASVVSLAGASLVDSGGEPRAITLLMHPDQRHRQRAQYFLTEHSDRLRVMQETRVAKPWLILPGCDAVLALGRDAGGLSLSWALASGVPVVTAEKTCVAKPCYTESSSLHVARSNAHKDLAHLLHGVLTDVTKFSG